MNSNIGNFKGHLKNCADLQSLDFRSNFWGSVHTFRCPLNLLCFPCLGYSADLVAPILCITNGNPAVLCQCAVCGCIVLISRRICYKRILSDITRLIGIKSSAVFQLDNAVGYKLSVLACLCMVDITPLFFKMPRPN